MVTGTWSKYGQTLFHFFQAQEWTHDLHDSGSLNSESSNCGGRESLFYAKVAKEEYNSAAASNCPASAGDNLLDNPMLKNTEPRNNTGS